jgi:hypothetical protein
VPCGSGRTKAAAASAAKCLVDMPPEFNVVDVVSRPAQISSRDVAEAFPFVLSESHYIRWAGGTRQLVDDRPGLKYSITRR